jgi:hypothetical protein
MDTTSLNTRRLAAWSGIAAVVLFGVGSAIWGLDMPARGTPANEVVDFYRDTGDRIVVGASLSLLAIAAFLPFAAALRRVLADAEGNDVLATTAFAGMLLALAAGLGAESINMVGALRANDDELSEGLAQALFEISQILGSTATGVGAGVFALATAAVALRSGGVLPRWAAYLTAVAGLAALSPLSHVNVVSAVVLIVVTLVIAETLLWTRVEPRVASQR